jgi:hypothetical protein
VERKNYSFYEIVMTYFEVYYRLNKEVPKKFADRIFIDSMIIENFKDFDKLELIKLTHLLSRYKEFGHSKKDAFECLNTVVECFLTMDLSTLTKSEVEALIINLSFKQVNPHLELFTYLEPYVLKYIADYSIKSLVNIFSAYVKGYCGTNFFLQTLGYTIASKLPNCNIIDLDILLELSDPKYFNRPELTITYSDLFKDIVSYIMANVNDLKFESYMNLLEGMINLGISSKKYNQVICTNFLRYHNKLQVKEYIHFLTLFAKLDVDSEVFWKNCIETLHWDILCLYNYLMGYDNMDNYIGMYDKKLITELNKRYMNNINEIKDTLKHIEETADEENLTELIKCFSNAIWITTYSQVRHSITPNNELVGNLVHILNRLISLVNKSDSTITIEYNNIKGLLYTFIYFNIYSKQLKLDSNLNIDFISEQAIFKDKAKYNKGDFEQFLAFVKQCRGVIEKAYEVEKVVNNFENLGEVNLRYLLLPDYFYYVENKQYAIFINDPLDSFARTFNATGLNKVRAMLCKMLKLVAVELDYNELNEMMRAGEVKHMGVLISDYLTLKLK